MTRRSGVLLHPTSLATPWGIGDLGPAARDFADRLAAAGQAVWQLLPLGPTSLAAFNDPYHSVSAFAGNPLLVSPDDLVAAGLLEPSDLDAPPFPAGRVDYAAVTDFKSRLLRRAFERFDPGDAGYRDFVQAESSWLEDYALFAAIKESQDGRPWIDWPAGLRDRDPAALARAREELAPNLEFLRFQQFLFARQWSALRAHCRARGLRLFGDMAIYVDHDSVEVWKHPRYFKLGPDLRPAFVSGVPPDYFSATGQLWGTPVYDWDALRRAGFDWWLARIRRNLALFDLLRVDHFRGLVAYWEVAAGEPTALNGRWVEAPVYALFSALSERPAELPLVAEDLGVITPDVREAMARLGLPGMAVLQFAFGDDARNPFLPQNIKPATVAYLGTHDNDTTAGWLAREVDAALLARIQACLGTDASGPALVGELLRALLASAAELTVVTVPDLLVLDSRARMNRPGNLRGNWEWRLAPGQLDDAALRRLAELTRLHGR